MDVGLIEEEEDGEEMARQQALANVKEWRAGRAADDSPDSMSISDDKEYESEDDRPRWNPDAAEIFDLSLDGRHFRNPFMEDREDRWREMSEEEAVLQGIDDVLALLGLVAVPGGSQLARMGEIQRAVEDESTLGSMGEISEDDQLDCHTNHFTCDGSEYETDSVQEEIKNLFGEQYAVLSREWTVWPEDTRRASRTSDYSSPSRPGSPILHNNEVLLYSPIENPWHANEKMFSVTDIEWLCFEKRFIDAAIEFFAGFEVEALVADFKIPGYRLEDTDAWKGVPNSYKLDPHVPNAICGCYWCRKYFEPSFDDLADRHDPTDWCHCTNCKIFRAEEESKKSCAENERKRAEQEKIWRARFMILTAEVDDAKADEESALLDLMDFKGVPIDGDDFAPKKHDGLGDWVRNHLRSPGK
jgi:hypothetical protein